MKTTMKQLTAGAILGLLLIVGNVNAEGKEIPKNSSSLEVMETKLELESWMTDVNIWSNTSAFKFEDAVQDESLVIEDWMISDEIWSTTQNFKNETEKEIDLKLESWMTDLTVWNR